MSPERYREVLTEAFVDLSDHQSRLERDFRLGSYDHYDFDQAAGRIVFSDSGVPKVVADIQIVGDVSRRDSTWLWAWANSSVVPTMQSAARRARWVGWRRGIRPLREAHWPADQVDGWEMTSLTAKFAGAEGAYRVPVPDSSGYTFLLLRKVRWAPVGSTVEDLLNGGTEESPADPARDPAR
jgi:hypothetical protein